MEVGLGQRDGIPADEMRVAGFVRALVEIGPEGLREDGRVVAEDEVERDAQLYLPPEESVAFGYGLAREGAMTLDACHLVGCEALYVLVAAYAARGDHGSDAVGLEIVVIGFTGHLTEELHA